MSIVLYLTAIVMSVRQKTPNPEAVTIIFVFGLMRTDTFSILIAFHQTWIT